MASNQSSALDTFTTALHSFGKELLCPICLSLLTTPVRLSCNHYFCKQCIEHCLNEDKRCPVCKIDTHPSTIVNANTIENLIHFYRILISTDSDQLLMSQPPTPSKLKRVFKKKNEPSPKRSHSSSLSRNSSIDNQKIISSNKKVVTQQRMNHSSFVFLLTGLDNSQRHLVNHICTNSSTQIVPEYTDEVTHCITSATKTEDGFYLANRTTKYLLSILHHKPIIAFDWIRDIANVLDDHLSLNKQRTKKKALTIDLAVTEFPSWKPYLVHGDYQVQELIIDGPIRSFHSSTYLFQGMKFRLVGSFQNSFPTKAILKELIQSGGGIVLDSDLIEKENEKKDDKNQSIILNNPISQTIKHKKKKRSINNQTIINNQIIILVDSLSTSISTTSSPVVLFQWLLDSISNYQLQPFAMYQ